MDERLGHDDPLSDAMFAAWKAEAIKAAAAALKLDAKLRALAVLATGATA